MSTWLRNKRDDDDESTPTVRPEVDAALPASVRPPDRNRFAEGADDADDADLDFLTALAGEVDRATPAAGVPAQMPLRGANPRIDDMQVFREMKDEGDNVVRYNHQVRDVEMGDLLEELNTVAAALRRRRAA